jgi:hypothetical protein
VNCAMEHISRVLALMLVRSLLTFSWIGYACYACEQIRGTYKNLSHGQCIPIGPFPFLEAHKLCLVNYILTCLSLRYLGLHAICRLFIKPPWHMLRAAKK